MPPSAPERGLQVVADAWLSERFGHPAFSVAPGEPAAEAGAVARAVEDAGAGSFQARVPAGATDARASLEQAGFTPIGEALTLTRGPGGAAYEAPGITIRPAERGRDDVVGEIAARAFRHSRFHADPEIPDEVASEIKREWALNCLRGGRGDAFWVADSGGAAIGFLALLMASPERAVLDLVAVDPAHGSRGAGAALVARFLSDAGERGAAATEVGTQSTNERALAFYERLGFARSSAATDLHHHSAGVWSS